MATTSRPRPGTKSKSAARSANKTNTNMNRTSVSPAVSRSNGAEDPSVVDDDSDYDPDPEDNTSFPQPQFYDTSFSAHRVSPLYLGPDGRGLSNKRLGVLAQRLRDVLVGDVVRGVEVSAGLGEDSAMGRYGALERVGIRWVSLGRLLDIVVTGDDEDEEGEERGEDRKVKWERRLAGLKGKTGRVLQICLEYENHLFEGLLLPAFEGTTEVTGQGGMQFFVGDTETREGQQKREVEKGRFLNMPLLLLRMPPPLKTVIAEFLSTTFDCRVSSLRLGTRSLVLSLENWFRTVVVSSRGPLGKDVVVWLGFYFPAEAEDKDQEGGHGVGDEEDGEGREMQQLGLKSIDVSIPVADLRRFTQAGRELVDAGGGGGVKRKSGSGGGDWGWETDLKKRRKLAGRLFEEGWEWRVPSGDAEEEEEEQPFTEALGRYIDQHLGLNIFHPGVRVTKVACGGFVMSEGKLKVFAPSNLGDEDATGVSASSPGQRGGVLELIGGLVEKAGISPERFLA